MSYPQQFVLSLKSYIEAVRVLFTTHLWITLLVPLGLSVGLYFGGELLMDEFKQLKPSDMDEENGSQYLLVGVHALLIYATKFMDKYVVLTLLTPMLTPLSSWTEKAICGNKYPLIFSHYVEDIVRAMKIVLRNMLLQMLWMVLIYTLTFIYGLPEIVNQVAYYAIAIYFYGFFMMDYANERRRLSVKESVVFTRKNAVAALVLGGVYAAIFRIPYAGVVFAPIVAVVAGTITVHWLVDLTQNPYAIRPGQDHARSTREEDSDAAPSEIEIEVE